MTNEKTNSLNLLKIEELSHQEWFSSFEELKDPLTKCLLLVAVMSSQDIIDTKELLQFKEFLMRDISGDKNNQIVTSFHRNKSLYVTKSEIRGHLGLPRMRQSDTKVSPPRKR